MSRSIGISGGILGKWSNIWNSKASPCKQPRWDRIKKTYLVGMSACKALVIMVFGATSASQTQAMVVIVSTGRANPFLSDIRPRWNVTIGIESELCKATCLFRRHI